MLRYAEFLHHAGYATLLFDFRAHGWSGGGMTTFGCREPLDLRAALDWVESRPDLCDLPLVLLGESMGAAVSLLVAAEEPRVRCVVADCPYARFDSAVEGRLRLAFGKHVGTALRPPAQRAGERFLGVRCTEIAPVEAIAKIAPRPVFLIHGSEDRLILPENTEKILEAAPGNARRWVVQGARHARSVRVAGEEYDKRVLAFLDEALAA
jgi:pimeloyl-ACP methyl ester carboxylesterase